MEWRRGWDGIEGEIFSILGAQDDAGATKQPRTTKYITEQKRSLKRQIKRF
jgi:hypothetical protein